MLQNEIEALIKPAIEDMGYTLWGCEYLSQGRHSLLRIYIDKADGVIITDCEKVSKQVSSILDVEDPISGNYSLEVSSPGIPRPLFHPWQYELFAGKEVYLKLAKPVDKKRKIHGIIKEILPNTLILNINDEPLEIPFPNIVKANLTE
jgi:ribosome maturation factor RimP